APARLAATADRGGRYGRDGRRGRDRPALLPELPAPARLRVRAALRRAARRLAARGRALHGERLLRRPRCASRTARRVGRGLCALPVALAEWPLVVDRPGRACPPGPCDLDRIAAELCRGVRAGDRCGTAAAARESARCESR